jgi:plastocyanin
VTRWIGLATAAAVVIAVPAFASGQPDRAPGSIVAVDFGFENPADDTPLVMINPGEKVTFSYPSGSSFHNVRFTKEQPSSCTLTAGGSGPVPPLPAAPTGKGWSGTCTFNAEGTYEFVCGAHDDMIGAVLVVPVTTTPTPTPSSTATATATASATATVSATATASPYPSATATSTASATATAGPSPTATAMSTATAAPTPATPAAPQPTAAPGSGQVTTLTAAASRVTLSRTQRGQVVKGSLAIARAGSRLRVDILAKRKRLGRTTRTVAAGRASFTVKLNARAKRTLQRTRRLTLTVRITVTPPSGPAFTTTRTVSLRR